jgi:hypothetical protein
MKLSRSLHFTTIPKMAFVLIFGLMSFAISIPANAFPEIHTVTFSENASAVDPVTSFQTGSSSQALTLIANLSPSFMNAGYTFTGWNTLADGTGISYSDGSIYSFNADVGLYAQWVVIPVTHTVTFNENDSAQDPVSTYLAESAPTPLTLFASLQPTFTDAGYSFSGWNTLPNGSGAVYADGSQYSFSSDLSLYAQWTLNAVIPVTHTVTFNENDSAQDPVSTYLAESAPTPLTLFASLQPKFANASHTFFDWNTSVDGSGVSYSNGEQYSFKSDLILYAQWTLTVTDTFSFSANGGSGSVATMSGLPGSTLTLPGQSGLIRAGYVLVDWNTRANGSGTSFRVGELVTVSQSTEFYAQWSGHKLATLFGAIGSFKSGSPTLSSALKSQIDRVALTIRSRKYRTVDLFGYTSTTGLQSLNVSLSRSRARNVANYLRVRLAVLKVRGVRITSVGEGAIAGQSSNSYSRVEVFGV